MADFSSVDEYRRPEPTHSRSDLSLCATLLSLFDFGAQGYVTRKDWDRGLSTLLLGGLSEDESLWKRLLELYDPETKGAVQLASVRDLLPIDPRISVLLQQLVHSVAGCREYVANATKKQARDTDLRAKRAVINLRKRLLAPIFGGWLEVVRTNKTLKIKAARYMRYQGVGKAFNSWISLVENNALVAKKRHRMGRILTRMQSRGVSMALNRWIEMIDERAKAHKLIRRALNTSVLRAWNTWSERAAEHAWLRKVVYRGLHAQVTRAFNSIRDSADDARRMRSIGARALGGPVVRAFNTWIDSLGEMARMKRFLRRALNRGLARAWERWLEMLDERAVMAKFAKRALNRDLARGWMTWQGMLEERARMRGIGARMQNAGLARAWNAWCGLGDELEKMRKVVARGLQGHFSRAFNKWVEVSEQVCDLPPPPHVSRRTSPCEPPPMTFHGLPWSPLDELLLHDAAALACVWSSTPGCASSAKPSSQAGWARRGARGSRCSTSEIASSSYFVGRSPAVRAPLIHAHARISATQIWELPPNLAYQKPAGPVAACAAATLRELTRFYALSCACADLLRAWNQWLDVAEELRRLRTIGSRIVGAPLAHALRRWLEHIEELNQVRRLAKSRQVSWSSLAFHGLRRPLRDRRL